MTVDKLFGLVAPIALCGAGDGHCGCEAEVETAWKKIRHTDPSQWKTFGCPVPPVEIEHIAAPENFELVYWRFARDAYDALLDALLAQLDGAEARK